MEFDIEPVLTDFRQSEYAIVYGNPIKLETFADYYAETEEKKMALICVG